MDPRHVRENRPGVAFFGGAVVVVVGYAGVMRIPLRLSVILVGAALALSCATAKKAKRPRNPKPPEAAAQPTTEEMDKDILAQTKQTASEQLDCPVDQLIARCTDHDAQGGCIAINVRGCEKTLDYQFGTD